MTDVLPVTFPLRLATASSVCSALMETLGELNVSGSFLNALVSNHVKAVCISCGTTVNGDELIAAALAANVGDLKDVRLARLKQGCCCREACESDYYKLIFAPNSSVNWTAIAGKLEEIQTQEYSRHRTRSKTFRLNPGVVIKVTAGVALVVVVLVVRYLVSSGSIPGLRKEPKYRIDPASASTGRLR